MSWYTHPAMYQPGDEPLPECLRDAYRNDEIVHRCIQARIAPEEIIAWLAKDRKRLIDEVVKWHSITPVTPLIMLDPSYPHVPVQQPKAAL